MLAQCWNLAQRSKAQAQESLHVRALSSLELYITLALGKGEGLELRTNRTMPIIQPRRQGNIATSHNQKRSDPGWQLPQIGSELFLFFKTKHKFPFSGFRFFFCQNHRWLSLAGFSSFFLQLFENRVTRWSERKIAQNIKNWPNIKKTNVGRKSTFFSL